MLHKRFETQMKAKKENKTGSTTRGTVLLFRGRWEGVSLPIIPHYLVGVLLMLCNCILFRKHIMETNLFCTSRFSFFDNFIHIGLSAPSESCFFRNVHPQF